MEPWQTPRTQRAALQSEEKENLAESFAEVDAAAVRQELNRLKLGEGLGCAPIWKAIAMPTFLKSLTDLVLRQAA